MNLGLTGLEQHEGWGHFWVINSSPGNKDVVSQNPLMEKESYHAYICDNEHLSRLNKHWIFKSMWSSSLKYIQEFYTHVCYCRDIDFTFSCP